MKTREPSSDPSAPSLEVLRENLRSVREDMSTAAGRAGRSPESIELLVVTKYVGTEVMRRLYDLGIRDFGENRVQPALRKVEALKDIGDLRFHFVGHLQRNKAGKAVEAFSSIHSLDSARLAAELESRLRARGLEAPDLYVEVNISGERQKTGLPPEGLTELLEVLAKCPRLHRRLRGLMGMAPYNPDPEAARPSFRHLRRLRDAMRERRLLPPDAGLSMGMSSDFQVAIEEGATVVRVGSRIYE